MTSTMTRTILITSLLLFFIPNHTSAEMKTFIKEYTYQASEADSKQTSRILALQQVKRLLLEELGTYLESETVVKNFRMSSDQIKIFTAGVVSTRVLEERWDGVHYWLKAEISSDPGEVARAIDILRNDFQKVKEIKDANDSLEIALKDIERLKNELGKSKSRKQKSKIRKEYDMRANKMIAIDWRIKGYKFTTDALTTGNYGYYQKAIDAFKMSINLDPQDRTSYILCASNYTLLKEYKQAINILNVLIKRNPTLADGYLSRGVVYNDMGNFNQALKDYNKVIKLDPDKWPVYYYKGMVYFNKGDYVKSINELSIEINVSENRINKIDNDSDRRNISEFSNNIDRNLTILQLSSDYGLRGRAYYLIGNNKLAISNFSKAIELLPKYKENALIYALRSQANFEDPTNLTDGPTSSNKFPRLLSDVDMAIELNPNESQYYLFRSKVNAVYYISLISERYKKTGLNYEQIKQKASYDPDSAEFVRIVERIKNQMDIDYKIASHLQKKSVPVAESR
ncbi:MAG: tetratricopeptide repeat protein [Syntrophales bacterium]